MSPDVTQSLRIVTSDAWTVMEPEMFLPATTVPSVVTVMGPDGASWEQLAPVLVASGKPHEWGLATQSVCRVTGPLSPLEGDGVPWGAGSELDAGSPPPVRTTPGWAQGRVKPTGFWSPAGLDGVP